MAYFSGEKMTGGYGGADKISSCTINVNIGEIVAILGPNGAGKTNTIKCITGILKCDKGTIIIDGKNIENNDILTFIISKCYIFTDRRKSLN